MSIDFIKMVSDLNGRRFLRIMQSLVANRTSCGIFFAPDVPADARQTINSLKGNGLNLNCVCVLTDEQKKSFQAADGERLITAEEFPSLADKPKYVFALNGLSTMFMDYFGRYGTNMLTSSDINSAESLYYFYTAHLPELYEVHEMLADDESKKVFRASITGKLTNVLNDFRFAPEPQYFLNGFFPQEGDISIDGGSYDGGTSADFAKQGAQVYAFEMDAANYKNCLAPAEKFGFTIENLGLSKQEGEAIYYPSGTSSTIIHTIQPGGGVIGHFIDLDTYVTRKNLPRVDYIKLDIEGSELDMLHGAAKTIVRWKPKMAVCAYHRVEDLWTLAFYIKSLRSDYEFAFRHYRGDAASILKDDEKNILKHFGLSYSSPSGCEMVLHCK